MLDLKIKIEAYLTVLVRQVATGCIEEAEGASPKKAPPTKEN